MILLLDFIAFCAIYLFIYLSTHFLFVFPEYLQHILIRDSSFAVAIFTVSSATKILPYLINILLTVALVLILIVFLSVVLVLFNQFAFFFATTYCVHLRIFAYLPPCCITYLYPIIRIVFVGGRGGVLPP